MTDVALATERIRLPIVDHEPPARERLRRLRGTH